MPRIEVRRNSSESPWTYRALDQRQRKIAEEVRAGGAGALLISEVAPVITMGRRAGPSEILLPKSILQARGVDIFPTDRGGLATYHGPGQWVVFAVDTLENLTGDARGVRAAVEGLLNAALDVGKKYDPTAEIRSGAETGVWTRRGKFAAVGIHIEQRVVLHGLSVNGFKTETSFLGLRPCGLDAPVDFLLPSNDDAVFNDLGERLTQKVTDTFWYSGASRKRVQ